MHLIKRNSTIISIAWRSYCNAAKRGRNYELHTINVLNRMGLQLNHCGGAYDKGVDFRGCWNLNDAEQLKVIGDCKNLKIACGPVYVRSLNGTLDREPDGTIGILVSRKGFTKEAHKAFKSNQKPMILISINDENSNDGGILRYFDRNSKCHQLTPNIVVASTVHNGLKSFQILLHDNVGNFVPFENLSFKTPLSR